MGAPRSLGGASSFPPVIVERRRANDQPASVPGHAPFTAAARSTGAPERHVSHPRQRRSEKDAKSGISMIGEPSKGLMKLRWVTSATGRRDWVSRSTAWSRSNPWRRRQGRDVALFDAHLQASPPAAEADHKTAGPDPGERNRPRSFSSRPSRSENYPPGWPSRNGSWSQRALFKGGSFGLRADNAGAEPESQSRGAFQEVKGAR